MDQQRYLRLVSGQATGRGSGSLGALLRLAALSYGGVIRLRNALYGAGLLTAHRVPLPVICVGNLTTGGTGKTPLVAWLCRFLTERLAREAPHGSVCVILTRAYKSAGTGRDEPALLSRHCDDTPVLVNADRIAGARRALAQYHPRVLVMDDGFQHRRLARDLDIVTIDATIPFGYDRLLPAGLLREPMTGLRRAHAVVVTRVDQTGEDALQAIERRIKAIAPHLPVARTRHCPVSVTFADGRSEGVETLAGKRLFAFCGIGNPDAFLKTLNALGVTVVGKRLFDDHHPCRREEIVMLCDEARRLGAELLITTEKNMPVLDAEAESMALPLAALRVELRFTAGEEGLKALIEATVAGTIPPNADPVAGSP